MDTPRSSEDASSSVGSTESPAAEDNTRKNILERIASYTLGRYALSLGPFAILLAISALLLYFEVKISLTILILVGLVIAAWYGGLGPGILMAVLIVGTTIIFQPKGPETSLAKYAFSHFSNFALIVFIVVLIHSRKLAELKLTRKSRELQTLNDTLERRVAKRTSELQQANRELEAFSYSVSHDLRAPLRAIGGFSEALLEDHGRSLDQEGKDLLYSLRGAATKMDHLVDDMLQLATATKAELRRSEVNLSEMARDILYELQRQEPDRKIEWEVEDGVMAFADKRLVRIALENLIENAWKFTSKVSMARIEFGKLENVEIIEYFVRDNGAGFDMQFADKLFGPFERLHAQNEFDGTGVGLATVQRVIHKHGGFIRGEGSPGKGAQFYFTL